MNVGDSAFELDAAWKSSYTTGLALTLDYLHFCMIT